jgi:arylsulfatase A-like enzyme
MKSSFTRRSFLQTSAAVVASGQHRTRPSVLLVTSDQETALLPARLNLPNRQRLQKNGITFSHAFCTSPQCSPARASILTGLSPIHSGTVTNIDYASYGRAPSTDLPSLGSIFQSAGYATGYFGKWHLGGAERGPDKYGFSKVEIGTAQNSGAQADGPATQMAIDWIRSQKQPWFAWVSLLDPHDIYYPPQPYDLIPKRAGLTPPYSDVSNLKDKPWQQTDWARRSPVKVSDWLGYRSYYCQMVEKVDERLGSLIDAAGGPENTIIAYTSDHGDALGEHGLAVKAAFMYEELLRIPFVIAAPQGRIGRGVRGDFTLQTDILPTLASLAGLPVAAGLDGIDLTRKSKPRDAIFASYAAQQENISPIRTIRTLRWKLNWYDDGGQELYDLDKDPHELDNLAKAPVLLSTREELERRLNAWSASITDLEKQSPGRFFGPKQAAPPRP